jgi:hypothetical protein
MDLDTRAEQARPPAPRVRSRPLAGERIAQFDQRALKIGAACIAAPLWLAGAHYTLRGVMQGINGGLAWLSTVVGVAPVQVAPVDWLAALLTSLLNLVIALVRGLVGREPLTIPPAPMLLLAYVLLAAVVGFLVSRIELSQVPLIQRRAWRRIGTGTAVVWLVANGLDIGSTYAGVTAPNAAGLPIQLWLQQSWLVAFVWSVIVTYAPEALFVWFWRR